jgi:hypothetical protein
LTGDGHLGRRAPLLGGFTKLFPKVLWPRIRRQGCAGMDYSSRCKDGLYRGWQPVGERLDQVLLTRVCATNCSTAKSSILAE